MSEEEQEAIEVLESFEYREKTKQYNKLDLGDVRTSKTILNLIDRLQKELRQEKEKNEEYEEVWNCQNQTIDTLNYTIRKLQKELEQEKEKNKKLNLEIQKEYEDSLILAMENKRLSTLKDNFNADVENIINDEFISKDKIKDILEYATDTDSPTYCDIKNLLKEN